jgi:hypothetical protein
MSQTRENVKVKNGLTIPVTYERPGEIHVLRHTDGLGCKMHIDMRIYNDELDCRKGEPYADNFMIRAAYHPGVEVPKLDEEGNAVVDEKGNAVVKLEGAQDSLPKELYDALQVVLGDIYTHVINKSPEYKAK